MKWFIGLLLITAALVAWLYVDRDARQRWLAGTPLAPAETTVYKWRDADGEWQISDKPPAAGIDYERLQYHHDSNAMPLAPTRDD
ncbi:hypothetical protein J2T55_001122 [Methylohalomonas lacus]|uniref:DUF4124 domain-containing protein n=1 Tax=Methylohalomonas lacus TaxID=398773 RepID=A0AAE3HIX5_9GAMM|nr:DUF4124 domain-containing protein [Methylohalomonas lacus]MCS3903105.1 hypothetical protein [Methylohalomonas lacus]